MKRNKVFKIASALLLLCVLTTCVIGTTFAKYTSADGGFDNARVAKWGVIVAADGSLFGKNYDDAIVADGDANIAVSGAADVVAPGTKNESGFMIKIEGQPEVDFVLAASTVAANNKDIVLKKNKYAVMVEVTDVLNHAADITAYYTEAAGKYTPATTYTPGTKYYRALDEVDVTADYYPVVWEVTNTGADTVTISATKITEVANALVTAINGMAKQTNEAVAINYLLKWKWEFGTDLTTEKNGADTILGHLQAGGVAVVKWDTTESKYVPLVAEDYNLEIGFNIEVGASQVD